MFWKKKEEEEQKAAEQPAVEKPCCSGKKKAESTSTADEHAVKPQELAAAVSTFEFGGSVASGIKLMGNCQGTDPNSIQACSWSPSTRPHGKHTILF